MHIHTVSLGLTTLAYLISKYQVPFA